MTDGHSSAAAVSAEPGQHKQLTIDVQPIVRTRVNSHIARFVTPVVRFVYLRDTSDSTRGTT